MNAKAVALFASGIPLVTVTLRDEQDIVSLCRRTRAAGEQFGIEPHTLRRLSAGVYDLAQHLGREGVAATAQLTVADGPSLQVVFHPASSDSAVRERILACIPPLQSMVPRLSVSDDRDGFSIRLGVLFPEGASDATIGQIQEPSRRPSSPAAEVTPGRYEALKIAHHELQAELQETNRGVVALYAELDDRAERLRIAEDRLRLMLDSVQDYAIFMIDPQGEITTWNAGAERVFGYQADEVVGRPYSVLFPPDPDGNGAPFPRLDAPAGTGRMEREGACVCRAGTMFDANVVVAPVLGAGQALRGYSVVVRDVTERKRLEDSLRTRAEELDAANRAKEEFLATLSHELRTPLNAMLGWTRLLRSGRLDPPGEKRALETIERNARLQEQLIADILDVSRIVTGKLRLDARSIDLEPIVDTAVDAVRPAADAKGLTLENHVVNPGMVLGDPDRLQQVIWNLLANAIKFTPMGGRISVSLSAQDRDAILEVSDTGEGIAPELLPFIFDRFRQGDTSVTRPHGGLGLGLSIVRHIVELHGGRVSVSSNGAGSGSTFTVALPLH